MKIVMKKLRDVKPYKGNAKEHTKKQIDQIVKSIEVFGFNDPIAVDENNTVIEGHGRCIAGKKLGMKEVPCIVLSHLTEEQKKAYILAHNKLTMNTGFVEETLHDEIQKILDIDMHDFGFDTMLKDTDEKVEFSVKKRNRVTVDFKTPAQATEFFEEMQEKGFECKLKTSK